MFGSCSVGDPQPTDLVRPGPTSSSARVDALWTYARQLQRGEVEWPDALLLLGDQVYADEVSPAARVHQGAARPTEPPSEQIADFEEYTQLYRESWSEPDIRWLLSTVPTAMIFDDHDVNDDWNISWRWVEEMRATAVVGRSDHGRIHVLLDLPAPRQSVAARARRGGDVSPLVKGDDDAGPRLREAARRCDRESAARRWAYYRDFGDSRLLVIDSRAAASAHRRPPRDDRRGGVGLGRRALASAPSTIS